MSLAGDTCVTISLAGSLFFNISPGDAKGRTALALVLTMAPFAVVAPFLGPAIDRIPGGRRLTVFGAAAGRVIGCFWMAEVVDSLLLFPAAFAVLVLSKAHAVGKSSLVPTVVEDEARLVEANSKLALLGVVVGFVAALPAIAVLQLDAAWSLRLGALTFAAAAVAALRIEQLRPDDPDKRALAREELHDPGIRLAASAMAMLRAGVGFLTFLIAFSFRRSGAPSWWFGIALAASLGGTLLGSAVAPRLRALVREERILTGALFTVAVGGLAAARLSGRGGGALLAAVLGVAASAGKLAFDSLVQRDAPDAAQGRSFARFEAGFQLVWVAGALVPVVVAIPERVGYFAIAVGAALSALSYLSGRRALGVVTPPRSDVELDTGEPEPGGVDLGGRRQLPS